MPEFVAPGDSNDKPTEQQTTKTTSDGEVQELRNEVQEQRNEIAELERAVSELARAIESLSQGQAKLSDYDVEATARLNDSALGDIYSANDFDRGGS
jgi:hypothetical protein